MVQLHQPVQRVTVKEVSNSWEANPGQLETESIPGFTPSGQLGRAGQSATSSELVRSLPGQADQRAGATALVAEPGGKGSLEGRDAIFLPRKTKHISDG